MLLTFASQPVRERSPWPARTAHDDLADCRVDAAKALQGLCEVASKVPNVRVSEHVIPECPSIIEAEHMQLPVWEVPNRARSTGGLALIGLCDEVFAYFGLAATH